MPNAKETGLITAETQVEEIMEQYPKAVRYFLERNIVPIFCVGAFPDNLGRLLQTNRIDNQEAFIQELNQFIRREYPL